MEIDTNSLQLEAHVQLAQQGNLESLDKIIVEIQQQVYSLSLRFLSSSHDAEDASQEIIMRIIKNLKSFKGDSQFKTWTHRIACNTLISIKRKNKNGRVMSFEEFTENLEDGMDDNDIAEKNNPDYLRLMEEIRVGCTLAMLQCLDDDARMAYIIGEILEIEHAEGAVILEITPDSYRKRLSRARQSIVGHMSNNCGLVNENNRCRCKKQVSKCLEKGCINRNNLEHSIDSSNARSFPQALKLIRSLDETQRSAELFRNSPAELSGQKLRDWLRATLADFSQAEETV